MRGRLFVCNEKQSISICAAPFTHFASLVSVFWGPMHREGGKVVKRANRLSFYRLIMVSPMFLFYCFSVLVLGVKNLRNWNKAHD